jgi:GNAT superfamily N-acetyltransferase
VDAAHLTAASAANLAGWHDVNLRSLGYATEWVGGSWQSPDALPVIFFSAIAVRPAADSAAIATGTPWDRWIAVSDPWADLDLRPHGFIGDGEHAWMVREPATAGGREDDVPPELVIDLVADDDALVDFEAAEGLGFGAGAPPPHTWHGIGVLDDPRMRMWRGSVGGRTVSVSMAFAEGGVVGVYSVTTLPDERRRGYGAALTWRALSAFPDLPAVLQPSTMAEPLYRGLGFERFAIFRSWTRTPPEGTTP